LLLLKDNFISKKAQFCANLTLAIIAIEDKNPQKSLQLLGECERLLNHVSDIARGKFHNHRALALAILSSRDHNQEFRDRAIIEFTAADHYFSDAPRLCGAVKNNLARLYSLSGRLDMALKYVDEAIALAHGDQGLLGQWHDQKARIFRDHGNHASAKIEAEKAVSLLTHGEQAHLLKEAMDTLSKVAPISHPVLLETTHMTPLTCAKRILENDPNLAPIVLALIAKVSDPDGNPDRYGLADETMQFLFQHTPQGEQSFRDYLAELEDERELSLESAPLDVAH